MPAYFSIDATIMVSEEDYEKARALLVRIWKQKI
jgi:hypothetical protein